MSIGRASGRYIDPPRVNTIQATNVAAHRENRILTALPTSDRMQLFDVVSSVALPVKTVLFEPGDPIDAVYFPVDGVISLVTPFHDGAMVEVASVGNEGIVGVPLVPYGGLAVRHCAGRRSLSSARCGRFP